jgi:hypothetical protein
MDQVRIWLKLGVIVLALISACATPPRYARGKHYFLWANVYVEPPIPNNEISGAEARQLASAGKPFYEVDYDAAGNVTTFKAHRDKSATQSVGHAPSKPMAPRPP